MNNTSRVGLVVVSLWLTACTIKPARVQPEAIPASVAPTSEEQAFGDDLLTRLSDDYPIDNSSAHHDQLHSIFNQLAGAASASPRDWQVFLFDAPQVADIRAVHGNYIFVWSGVFEVTENQDELAGLLACEMAHSLARHTEPVKFNMASELLFGITDVATSVGLLVLTQGAVSVSGIGMSRWAYVEANDLDPVDRAYNRQQVEDMAGIALKILDNSPYPPDGLLQFWERAAADSALAEKVKRLSRETPPLERVSILEDVYPRAPWMHDKDLPGRRPVQVINLPAPKSI